MNNNSTDRELLEEILAKVEENTKTLNGIKTRARMMTFMGFVKWFIYIGLLIGAYSFVKPYTDQLLNTYRSLVDSAETINEIKGEGASLDINNMLNLFNR